MLKNGRQLAASTLSAIDAMGAMWARVDVAREQACMNAEAPPAGAFTVGDYAEKYGLAWPTAEGQLKRMVERKLLCSGIGQGVGKDGRMIRRRYYWAAE